MYSTPPAGVNVAVELVVPQLSCDVLGLPAKIVHAPVAGADWSIIASVTLAVVMQIV